jgi:adenylate cyclase, class 2
MPEKHPRSEVEVKLHVADLPAIRRRLKQLHARQVSPRQHESNTLYDSPNKTLAHRGQLLRIRIERPAPPGHGVKTRSLARAVLTYKGPSDLPRGQQRGLRRRYKVRAEYEVTLSDGEQMSHILTELHLRPAFRYEKFRTTYALPGLSNLKVELDETPIGVFLELEGPPTAIDRAARRLGYTRLDYIVQSYGSLYLAVCRRQGIKPADMLFTVKKN